MNHANFAETTLGAAITDTSGTAITVTSGTSFPTAPFIISIGTECLEVTSKGAGTDWTVVRGYEGSTAATHLNGAAVYHDWSAAEADSTVHGPASATDGHLAVFDATTGKLIKDGGAVPTTLPASDVYAWAKASTKPAYTNTEVGAAATTHSHAESDVTNLTTDLSAKAPLAGATFTGAVVTADHGTATNAEVVGICYGTADPPTASTTPIGTLFIKYTA